MFKESPASPVSESLLCNEWMGWEREAAYHAGQRAQLWDDSDLSEEGDDHVFEEWPSDPAYYWSELGVTELPTSGEYDSDETLYECVYEEVSFL